MRLTQYRYLGIIGRLTQERTSSDHKDTTDEVPRHIVAEFPHQGTIQQTAEHGEEDERQESNTCRQGRVSQYELEVQGDVIHRHLNAISLVLLVKIY